MLKEKKHTTLRDIEGIPKFLVVTSQFEGKTFHFPRYVAEGHRYFRIENGCAVAISDAEPVDIKAAAFDEKHGFYSSSFRVGEQSYYIAITDSQQVYVVKHDEFCEAANMSRLGIRLIDIPDTIVFKEQFSKGSFDEVSDVLHTIQTMTDIDEDKACSVIYREQKKLTGQRLSRSLLVMRVFQSPEFIEAVGATQWFREARERGNEVELLGFSDLGSEPLISMEPLEGHNMTCIQQDGPYRLLSSWTGAGAVWLLGKSAFFKVNEESFTIGANEQVRLPLGSFVTLDNANLNSSLILGDNPVITVEGENSISVGSHDSCIYANGDITIQGSGTLRLYCSTRSAAIGSGAESQSYGRYVPNFNPANITKIIIDGATVDVHCETPNFSIGTYGDDNDIPIEIKNGGKATGIPELLGKVVLKTVGITNSGSTKIEGNAVYELTEVRETSNVNNEQQKNPEPDVYKASHSFTEPKKSDA